MYIKDDPYASYKLLRTEFIKKGYRGDDLKFSFVLMGKANPANAQHEHTLLETKEAA